MIGMVFSSRQFCIIYVILTYGNESGYNFRKY
jgi:hypothetical protein